MIAKQRTVDTRASGTSRNRLLVAAVVAFLFLATFPGGATVPERFQAKLTANDGSFVDQFGIAVAVDGDTALIGASRADGNQGDTGAAYVYVRSGMLWTQQARLTAPDGASLDAFGFSVALSGDTALIGAFLDDDQGSGSGSAYVFVRSGASWALQAKLTAADGAISDEFGLDVALDGDTAVVGARRDDDKGTDAGSAYVFTRSGTMWAQQAKLTASDGATDDYFGFSVAVDGDTTLIGAFRDDGVATDTGSAYVFTRSGTTWSEQAKLTAPDGAAVDLFGLPVEVDSDTAVIGAQWDDDARLDSGSVYIFTRSGTTWSHAAKLTAGDGAAGDTFGISASISGNTLLVGASRDDDKGAESGSAYVFTRRGSDWVEHGKLTAPDGAAGDSFGYKVALSGATALIGAYRDDDNGVDSGSAHIFVPNLPPVAVITPVPASECTDGRATVTLDGSGSFDPEADPITYAWTASGISFDDATSAAPSASFPLGNTVVTLTVTDSFGAADTATATVQVVDTLPPTVVITRPVAGTAYVDDAEIRHGNTGLPITVVGPLTVFADAVDQCGIVKVTFLSSIGAGGSDAVAPYKYLHDASPLDSGLVTLGATALDRGGHTAQDSVEFVLVGTDL